MQRSRRAALGWMAAACLAVTPWAHAAQAGAAATPGALALVATAAPPKPAPVQGPVLVPPVGLAGARAGAGSGSRRHRADQRH
ncbi:hypothetical protein [Ralstonia pseudosolanacearum]|uniref:hypothetical protein n=1 Tax=Ralstonia pseudosolanacearum TaxID=1310165 RepID=UPI003D175581